MPAAAVLIVEDDAVIARDLKDTLQELGYRVVGIAPSADEAMKIVSRERPDVALTDIRLQGARDGVSVADELRRVHRVPVVFLSAHADEVTVARARRAAPFGYLVKPYRAMEVKCSIEVALYRAEMEQALEERQRWLETTLETLGDAVVCVDTNGTVRLMNRAAEKLTGWTAQNAQGLPSSQVVRIDDIATKGSHGSFLGALVQRLGGGETPVMRRETPITSDGQTVGSLLVLRDADEELRLRAHWEFLERMAGLGTLAASIAHEINNPLSVILGNLDLARDRLPEVGSQGYHEMLADARDAAIRIRTIVGDLRGLWQQQDQSDGLASVDHTIAWAVDVTAHETRHYAQVISQVEPGMTVALSHVRFGQVITNLVRMAARSMPTGERGVVRINAQRMGDRCVVEVNDNGPVIPEDIRGRLFEPFFSRDGHGDAGLGLFASRSILLDIGGDLAVRSRRGEGTTFTVTLPLANGVPTTALPPLPEAPETPRRARILLVDDDPATLMVLRRVLERAHDVVTANGGLPALERLSVDRKFDLMLLDVMMPDLPGDRVRAEVMNRFPDFEPRIVLITAGAVSASAKELVAAMGQRVLRKPLSPDELLDAVARYLAAG